MGAQRGDHQAATNHYLSVRRVDKVSAGIDMHEQVNKVSDILLSKEMTLTTP